MSVLESSQSSLRISKLTLGIEFDAEIIKKIESEKKIRIFFEINTLKTDQKSRFWEMASTRLNPESSICWKIFNQNFKSSTEWPIQAIFDCSESDTFC